jgi:hypothetical protein
LLLEDNPLKAKSRKRKGEKSPVPDNETPNERAIRIMEDMFTVYDFTKVDHDALEISQGDGLDLCERVDYAPTMEKVKPGNSAAGNPTGQKIVNI